MYHFRNAKLESSILFILLLTRHDIVVTSLRSAIPLFRFWTLSFGESQIKQSYDYQLISQLCNLIIEIWPVMTVTRLQWTVRIAALPMASLQIHRHKTVLHVFHAARFSGLEKLQLMAG